jgi:hypothetical protein
VHDAQRPQGYFDFSNTVGSKPFSSAYLAAQQPDEPAPIIATLLELFTILTYSEYYCYYNKY